jgi:NAD+ synthase
MKISEPKLTSPEEEASRIVNFIASQQEKIGFETGVAGISGGIDSSLAAVLTRKALPDRDLKFVFMPEKTTPERDARDVQKLSQEFELDINTIDIDEYFQVFRREFSGLSTIAGANIKARLRMILLYTVANEQDGLVIGTGNLSEWLLGYFTKYGDGAADIAPLLHLFKTEVKELARHLELPESIIEKPPSAGLWDGQTDEEELGGSYEDLDRVLYCKRELDLSREGTADKLEYGEDFVDHVYSLVNNTEHKRKNPPSLDR